MYGTALAGITVTYPLSTYTTILLSLAMAGVGFFMGGYYAGHSQFNTETSRGVRRLWTSVFTLVAIGATAFALRKIFYMNLDAGAVADGFEVTLISVTGGALGLAIALTCLIGLHERFPSVAAWTLSSIPAMALIVSEIFIIVEAFRPAGSNRGPDFALTYYGIFEVCAIGFLMLVVYGPRALGAQRDANALLMMTGMILFLVAPLIYALGPQTTESNALLVDRSGWFIGFHLAGIFFIFLAALPSPARDAEIERIIKQASAPRPGAPLTALVPTSGNGYSDPVNYYPGNSTYAGNGISEPTGTIVPSGTVIGRERR